MVLLDVHSMLLLQTHCDTTAVSPAAIFAATESGSYGSPRDHHGVQVTPLANAYKYGNEVWLELPVRSARLHLNGRVPIRMKTLHWYI